MARTFGLLENDAELVYQRATDVLSAHEKTIVDIYVYIRY